MKDTISRRAAIDALDVGAELLRRVLDDADIVGAERAKKYEWGLGLIESYISYMKELPPAQPEKRTEERTETHACDLISRQAAIDAILAVTGNSSVRELYEHVQEHGLSDMWSGGVSAAIDIIIAVPSAQPIRCKDCRWRDDYGHWLGCPVLNTDDDNFCSMAERRTDDTD